MSVTNTLCHALTYDRKYLKIKFCLQFIKEAGFSSLSHKGKIKLDWVSIYNFIYKENKNISTVFDSKPFKFITKEFDPKDGIRKKIMMEFINRRLEDWFGVRICRTNNKYDNYEIEVLFNDIL
jgi:hypothetical protein